jgi:hypothetical protein
MRKLTAVLALLVLLLAAAPARGDAVDAIFRDCGVSESGLLTGRYANADLREALLTALGTLAALACVAAGGALTARRGR